MPARGTEVSLKRTLDRRRKMRDLHLMTTVLNRHADWKLKRSFSGEWVYTKNSRDESNDTTRIYYTAPTNLPEPSADTLQLLSEIGIE